MGTTALILAAGAGTRMKSEIPKVAHEVLGTPMVLLVVDAARQAGCDHVVAVTGHGAELVESFLGDIQCVRQEQRHGTGHAVMCAREALMPAEGSLVVLSGDSPLLRPETIARLVQEREQVGAAVAVLTANMDDPTGYGRIVRGPRGEVLGIVEHKDLAPQQVDIAEINTGTYCFDAAVLFKHLDKLGRDNAQGEYYLTDMVAVFHSQGLGVVGLTTDDPLETLGINSRVQLAQATGVLQRRINERHMLAGVSMTNPDLVWIGPDVKFGQDVLIEPMTFVMGSSTVAAGAHLGPNTRITDSAIGEGARIDASILIEANVGKDASVGPVSYLRPGAVLETGAKAGACVEIKKSTVGEGSKVPHLSYIGDATIGKGVNVGAGSITCNFDGVRKHATVIEDGAFIGSDTMLVAPVRIGRGAVTGAASAITHDVPAGSLGVERSAQQTVKGWADRRSEAEAENTERRSEA